jgi:predicted nicotinamide N-methyase
LTPQGAETFIRANTELGHAPLVPELWLHLATEITPIWQASEAWVGLNNIAPPFWAFAWPGSQAMARHVLDTPGLAAGRRVLDFAAGGGLAALAAAPAGAARAQANDVDPLAMAAIGLNAAANALVVDVLDDDPIGRPCRWDLIMAGDVCYEASMALHILPWLRTMADCAEVWVADPGRAYLPHSGLERLADYNVPTTLELEDQPHRRTVIYRLRP